MVFCTNKHIPVKLNIQKHWVLVSIRVPAFKGFSKAVVYENVVVLAILILRGVGLQMTGAFNNTPSSYL